MEISSGISHRSKGEGEPKTYRDCVTKKIND
jgi:hypothetical protein